MTRRRQSRSVIVDTQILIRSIAKDSDYRHVLDYLIDICDHLVISDQITKEYGDQAHRVGLDLPTLQARLLDELGPKNKIRNVNGSGDHSLSLGIPKQDRKFLEAAAQCQDPILITRDQKIQDQRNRLRERGIRVIFPGEYQ